MRHFIFIDTANKIMGGQSTQFDATPLLGQTVVEVDYISRYATHYINGQQVIVPPEPIPPTEAEIIASLTVAVQGHLDSTARQRNYDGILSLCSYVTSLDPVFKAEGQAGVEWRDACWRMAYTIMDEVNIRTRPIPTSEELISELPPMAWP